MHDYLTAREAALRLAIPYNTLMGLIYKSKIRATRRGYYWFLTVIDVDAKRVELDAKRTRIAA